MKFNDYKYERPNLDSIFKDIRESIAIIQKAECLDVVINEINKVDKIRIFFDSMQSISSVRHSINTLDEFYLKENDFYDQNTPLYVEVIMEYQKALYNSSYKCDLIKTYGEKLFETIENNIKTFDSKIIPHLQKQAQLTTEYSQLLASAQIHFDNKILNLSQMRPYYVSSKRPVRIAAEKAVSKFYQDNIEKLDTIFDSLIKVRHEMALELGFKNFIELGYKNLERFEYTEKDVKIFRDEVVSKLVPLQNKIINKQKDRIKVDKLYSYDFGFEFLDGNATPLHDEAYKIETARKMYHELSEETKEFIDFMIETNSLDLTAKKGKSGGGYCTFIPLYKSPFVFSNFNGTSADIDVLTHEFGHAFQVYCSRNFEIIDYIWPTYEACEVHSMSMEFFAWPWMDQFFGADCQKYKYSHLSSSITFIPYACLVDEFQHEIYLNPNLTPQERKKVWRDLEKKYIPLKIYQDEFLDQGNYYLRQSHIYESPFYYIDYALAQNCAHQFFIKNIENSKKAWEKYLALCKLGGSKKFLELLKEVGLESPFDKNNLNKVFTYLDKWLDEFDI